MRYAIIADVHSNLEALQAVIAACKDEGVRKIFCAGDIVGYGANPKECIDLFEASKITSVAGNHDWAVAGRYEPRDFNESGKIAVEWTKKQLAPQYINYLQNLNLVFNNEEFSIVHSNLNEPQRFKYIFDLIETKDTFYLMQQRICFIGHTHIPKIFVQYKEKISYAENQLIQMMPEHKYIVNVGSVGQPRDGNPLASFAIYDPDLERIELKRVLYDIKSAQTKILEAGLPQYLAQRLQIGQ